MNTPRCILLAALMLLARLHAAPGATPALEPFDYADGTSISGLNGGAGWSNAWSAVVGNGAITVENVSLAYPGIPSSGGKMHFAGVPFTGTTTTSYRNPTNEATGAICYFRYLSQNLNNSRRYFGLGLFSNNVERALLGQGSGHEFWTLNHVNGITNALYTNVLVSAVNSTNLSLLVLKVEYLEGPERVTFWVNPDLSQPESASNAVGGASFLTDVDYGKINRVRVGSGGYSVTFGDPTDHYLDEIEIGPVSPFAPPALNGAVSGGTVDLSWPVEYAGWTLQTNASGLADVAAWGDVPETTSITTTNLPADPADPAVFYRLRSP